MTLFSQDYKKAIRIRGQGCNYKVLETYKGKDLEYIEYEPLYAVQAGECAKKQGKNYFVPVTAM